MKAKRFFSALLVVMMLVSCFAISASAVSTAPDITDGVLNIHLYGGSVTATNDASDASTHTETGADGSADVSGYTAISGSTFKIYKAKSSDETDTTYSSEKFDTVDNGEKATSAGVASFTGLSTGRYLVVNTAKADNQSAAVANFLVDVPMTKADGTAYTNTVDVYPKVPLVTSEPNVSKVVKGSYDDDTKYGATASIDTYSGEVANWKIVVTLPNDIATYKYYEINDDIDTTNLEVTGTPTVTVLDKNGAEVTVADGTYTLTTTENAEGKVENIKVKVNTFANLASAKDGSIVIKFDTKVKTVGKFIPNDVELTFVNSNATPNGTPGSGDVTGNDDQPYTPSKKDNNGGDPNDTPTTTPGKDDPENPDSETHTADPYVYTGYFEGYKVSSATTTTLLSGATFQLYTVDTEKTGDARYTAISDATYTTTADGKITFSGLEDKTYAIKETVAPAKYELNPNYFEFTIDGSSTEAGLIGKFASYTTDGNKNLVKDVPSTKLPLTGGMGVGVFAILGLALVAIGGVSAYKTRKSN